MGNWLWPWHDFFLLIGGASATLLGLVFVAASIAGAIMITPSLSPQHWRHLSESAIGPLARLVAGLDGQAAKLAQLRSKIEALTAEYFENNQVTQHLLMIRAMKRA